MLAAHKFIFSRIGGIFIRVDSITVNFDWENWEKENIELFKQTIKPGDTLLDVGSYMGVYSIIFLKHLKLNGRVIAYEPNSENLVLLKKHLEWNGCSAGTIVRNVFCGAKNGTTDFYFRPGKCDSISGVHPVDGFDRVSVPMVTIDSEVANLNLAPSIIKIDAEGSEFEVLEGAAETLNKYKPKLFLSLHLDYLAEKGISEEQLIGCLTDKGYSCRLVAIDHEKHIFAQ